MILRSHYSMSIWFRFCLTGLLLSPLSAEKTIEWESALQKVKKDNPDLLAAEREFEKARYNYRKVFASFMPQVAASASYRHTESETGINRTFNSQDTYAVGLSANQNIFAGLRDIHQAERAEANLKLAQFSLAERKVLLSYELTAGFAQLEYAQNLLILSEQIRDRRKLNRNLVQLRFEGGREHKGSYLLSEANLRSAEFDVTQAIRLRETGSAELARVMGMAADGLIRVTGISLNEKYISLDELRENLALHPALQQENERIKAANAGIAIADSQFYPEVNINASVSRTDFSWFPQNSGWSYGISASYPLFNGGRDYYESKLARAEYQRSLNQLDSRKLQLQSSLIQSWQQYRNALDNVEVVRSLYEAAETRARIARAQYSNGLLTFENWDIIENDLIQRQRTLLAAERDARLALAALNRAAGRSLIP